MYHHAVNVLINLLLAATLLSFTFSSLTEACGSKAKEVADPTYDAESDTVCVRPPSMRKSGNRFRRSVVIEQDIAEEHGLTTPASISNTEVFQELDLDYDDEVSVIEWSLEGGSVSDFWALLTRHDNNGDEVISRDEFAPIQVKLLS